MKTYQAYQLSASLRKELCLRPTREVDTSAASVSDICRDVKRRGDTALREYGRRFDAASVTALRVEPREVQAASREMSEDFRQALLVAASNIRTFHAAQGQSEPVIETMPGVVCRRERRPIEQVGLYVPAGSAPLPSTVLMLGIPATLAGCSRIVLCSPPTSEGSVNPYVLAAAEFVGISEIYRVGGAQAIAAMAYGTESIAKVDKIFGPGNTFVTAAKRFVSTDPDGAAIDLLAGPSELLVIADETADPRVVAADLVSQAEHDPSAHVVLVTTSQTLAATVEREVEQLLRNLPRGEIARQAIEGSLALVLDSLNDAVQFSNDYAPEHLILNVRSPEQFVPAIRNAGSVFLGSYAPVTAGDYASGTNHTLPTGGTAKWYGGISVESFQKSITFQTITKDGLQNLEPTLGAFADAEGLEGHKKAVSVRLK
ncbi:MAG TPA: histidinol dehydrogenase [Bacteroidetes bacterium]|nr:histidinol dehydrogenase [Bacteroidota bacterium]